MDGYLLTYNTNIPLEITNLNNKLFGRVVKVRRNNRLFLYYYSGLFNNIYYYKLTNGCYFITIDNNLYRQLSNIEDIRLITATVSVGQEQLITASNYFRSKYPTETVRNLD